MKLIKQYLFNNTLKRKVFAFVMVILLCFLTGFLYTFYITFKVNAQINEMFSTSIVLRDMKSDMTNFEIHLEAYLATKSSDSFVQYLDYYNRLNGLSESVQNGKNDYAQNIQMNNISQLLTAYLSASEEAIEFKRGRNTEGYLQSYGELEKIGGYITEKVNQLEALDLNINLANYTEITSQFEAIQKSLMLIVVLLIVLSFLFVYTFSTNVTSPIEHLSKQAKEIANGNYEVELIKGKHFEEAELLRDSFNDMASHIQEYISELKDKVETENKLRVSETEKLKMQNSLNEAELMALQSQINPHFLFNTLNAGMQLAIIEDADRTSRFLEVLSSLFRYNIQSLQNKVTLRDEFENALKYYELMRVRFGDQFVFHFDLDEETGSIEMPPLILQPIIENALIHGFKNKTDPGEVRICSTSKWPFVEVTIVDNGEGMTKEQLERLNQGCFTKLSDRGGHTTGLGLGNVYDRLRHFFDNDEVMSFASEVTSFTKVTIRLPRKDMNHA